MDEVKRKDSTLSNHEYGFTFANCKSIDFTILVSILHKKSNGNS